MSEVGGQVTHEPGAQAPASLRSFWTDLPRAGHLLLAAVAVDALGTGVVLPFSVVYLHEVRHIPLSTVGLLLSLPAAIALLLLGPIGIVIDRVGPRRVQVASTTLSMLGTVGLVFVHTPASAALALGLLGVGQSAFWPANQSLLASAIPGHLRQRYFGVNFTVLNAGIGVGGIASGLFVNVHHAWTFQTIYAANAVTFLVPMTMLAWPLRHIGGPASHVHDDEAPAPSYAVVLRDRVFRRFLAVTFMSAFVGYAQLDSGWTAYARFVAHISTRAIGLAFAANTAVIVLLQLPVLRRIEGRRRTRMLMVMVIVWALAWTCAGIGGLAPGTEPAIVLLIGSMAVFAFGETLQSPVAPALVNDLATDQLRGRYNAGNSVAFQIAAVVGPAFSGLLIGHGLAAAYIVVLVICCLFILVLLGVVERRISPAANGVTGAPVSTT